MTHLPAHFMVSECDGALYDTRAFENPVRVNYRRGHKSIKTVADLKATLRVGRYTALGGYPLYFLANDGEALSFQTVRENLRLVMYAIRHRLNDGWRVIACDINYEDAELFCAHSNEKIECAFGE